MHHKKGIRRNVKAVCCSGRVSEAGQHTDHIVPWPVCGTDGFFDTNNLQSLCADCNHKKGQEDKKVIQQWRINGTKG